MTACYNQPMHHFPLNRLVRANLYLILPFLMASLSAVGPSQISAYQFNQIFGWHSGDKHFVDTAKEMTPEAYAAFWKLDIPNRQVAFNFFTWPVIETLVGMEMDEVMAPSDPKKQAMQSRIRNQYENLANMLSNRYSLSLKLGDIQSGLMYFIEVGTGNGDLNFLNITVLFDYIDLL